mgnify:CR=1 FL=1
MLADHRDVHELRDSSRTQNADAKAIGHGLIRMVTTRIKVRLQDDYGGGHVEPSTLFALGDAMCG